MSCNLIPRATVVAVLAMAAVDAANAEPLHEVVEVFVAGQDNVHTYRIPGVVVTGKGTVLAFCEARRLSIDDGSPTDVVLKRSLDDGRTWQPMQTLVKGGIHYLRLPEPDVKVEAIMDPVPIVDHSSGTIWLNCTQYLDRKTGMNMLLHSTDEGVTWSEPIDIGKSFGGGFSAGPGMGIQLQYSKEHKGRLVIPGRGNDDDQKTGSFVIYSDDHGKIWRKGHCVPGTPGGECQVIEFVDGSLAINIRNGRKGRRAVAISKDGGVTWGEAYDEPQLPEPGCQASILRFTDPFKDDRNRILFSNPNMATSERVRMTVRLSYDDGKTWPVSKLLHPGPSAYSNLAIARDGTILCFYEGGEEHRREWIRLERFNLEWLTDDRDTLASLGHPKGSRPR